MWEDVDQFKGQVHEVKRIQEERNVTKYQFYV